MTIQKLPGFSMRTLVSAALASFAVLATESAQAAVMHTDVSIQTYTDFGQNMGRYTTTTNALLEHIRATEGGVYIYYTGGQENYKLQHGLINFEATADIGAYNAVGNNFIATVAHNDVQNPTFSGRVVGDANAIHYATIEYRYSYLLSPEENVFSLRPAVDYKIARTSKLITDVTGSTVYSGSTTASDLANQMLYRAGSGTQQLASYDGENTYLLEAYGYIIGGIMQIQGASDNTDDSLGYRDITDDSFSVSWNNYDWSSDAITANNPLPNTILGGDSGSPGWIWNEATQQYEYLAAGQSGNGVLSISRGATQWTTETMESYNKHVALTDAVGVITINAVTDTRADETVSCDIQGVSATPTYGTVTDANGTVLTDFVGVKSGLSTWHSLTPIKDLQNWYAYGNEYLNTNTATSDTAVSYADLFLTENLVFTAAQAQTTVDVGADVDLGIGYVQFSAGELSSAEFTLQSTGNHQLNSAGYIVDAGVDLYVTITNSDADYMREWRKVGDGNLHIAGTGNNEIFLNLGGNGKTYLEQNGGYAAYNVIANNGATVVIGDVNQIARDFTFGAGGGVLDMNGNSMEWKLNNTDVSAEGFTINALTEEAVITNTAGTAVTLTYTEEGDTTFVGSFKDTENGALKIVYNGGAEASWTLNGIRTDLLNNSGSGLEVASGKVTLVGTNTVHAVGSATGTNTNRYTNGNDWHYADAKMNVSVEEGATFELGSHARLTGNVTVADNGTFVMREGVKHQYEYIEGGYTLEDTYTIRDYYGLKGAVNLGDGATLKIEYSDGTTSENLYAGNIAGTGNVSVDLGTSGASLILSGYNTFTGTKTLTSGTLVAESATALGNVTDVEATKWLIGEAGVLAIKNETNLLSYVKQGSSGVLALTQDIETQLDLANNYKLIIGTLAGCKVNYGKNSSGTYSTLTAYNHDDDASTKNAWVLGGGGGELVVYFQLTGDNDLILGNQYGKGTVTLANANNDFSGEIKFGGQITLNYVDGALGESTVNLPYANRIFASANSLPALGVGSDGVLLLDNYSGTSIDISGSGYSDIYLGADTDKTITSITLASGDTTYRFGGTTGTLTVDMVLDDRNATAHNLLVDGQTYSGGKVILAQAATLTGTVSVIGYDSSKTNLTEGDITLGFSVDNALANASSVTIGVGGILDLNGTTQTFDTRLTTANGGIITDNSADKSGILILQYGSGNASLNIGELGTLQLDSGRFQADVNHAQNVIVNDGGQYHATAGTHSAVFTLAGTGWNASSDSAKDGALRLEGGAEITGGVSLAGDASVQVYHDTDAGTISGVVSTGEYTLTKIGDGTLTLDAAISGNLAMSAGTMTQSGSFSGTLAMNGGNLTLAGSSYASGSVIDLNAGTTTLSFGDRAFSATLNVNNGATANLTTTDGLNYNGSSSVVVNSGGALNLGSNRWTLASGNKLTLAGGTVSGEGQTATNDAGEVTGRYGALDFINSGNVVDVTASSVLSANVRARGSVDFAIADGATLDFSGNLYKYSGSNANFSKSGTGTLNFSGTADADVNLALNAGATTINSQDFRGNITVAENATLSLAGTFVLSQAIANSGSVTVDNTDITFDLGNLTISEDKVYTLISGGTITNWDLLDKNNFTVDGVVLSGRSGFSLGTAGTVMIDLSQTAASLVWASQNGSNVWNVEQATNWDNAGTVDKFYDGDAVTFSTADAAIDITENVVAGNVTATENVSFTSTATGGVTFSQIEGGIISVADGKTVAFDKTISTTGKLEIVASNGGKVSVAADAGTVASSVVVNEGSLFGLSVADASEATYSGAISGAGSFEKLGAGTLIFNTAQTYAGETYVSEGTLKITNKTALGTSNRVTIGTGATLDLAVNMDSTANAYVLAGGTLKASVDTHDGQRQIASGDGAIVLTADSTVDAAANFGMISSSYAANELDLAGYTLTKTGSANFYLANTTVTAGTIKIAEGTLNVTNHDTTDASAADIVIAGGTLHVGGNFLLKSVSGETGTLNIANGTNVIGSADFAGTTTIRGGNTTFSGSAEFVDIDLKGGTLNIVGDSVISNGITSETGTLVVGDGENSALVSVGRLELGNSNGGSSAFTVNANATLKVTGAENTWNDYTNYKTNSAVLGEWNNYTTTTIAGTLLAKDAEVGLGDYGGTFTIENGGLIAAKGIGQATSAKAETGKFELTLNDGGTLLLGTSGLSTTKTTNTVSLAAGTIGTFADSTTVATALTLTSETGTTFDTQKYVFADDGNSVTRGEDAAAMTVSGAISGTGNFIKTGAGTLTLSNNFGSFEGNFIVDAGELLLSGSNSGYTGQFVVNGGTLKLGTESGVLGATDLEGTGTRYAAVVNAGGTLDINGQTQGGSNCYQIGLAGGALVNNGSGVGTDQRQITGLRLSADSEIGGSGNFGLIASGYAANTLDLGGNTLTKTGSNTFWLASTTVTAGTFKIQEGKVEVISQTLSSVDASAAQFAVEGGELAIADNFLAGGISVSEGAAVTFGSGITVALGSTIQNAGTVTVGSGMIFNLDNLTPDGKNYVIISNTGTVSGWENLTINNFTHSTQSNLRLSEEAGTYYVYAYHGALTWVGATDANGAGTWDLGSSALWTYDNNGTATASCFFNEDDVIFATDGAQVTVASGLTVAPASMTINDNVTFLGENYTIAPTGTVTIAADKTLSLDGTGTLSGILANSGTIVIGADTTIGVSASSTALGTITGSGRIELPNTTLTDGTTFRDASTWTGTVAFTESLGGNSGFGFSVSNYGNTESVVELNGFAGGYFTEQANGTIASDLVLNGDVNLTNGNGGMTLTVDGAVSGSGSFSYNFDNGQIFVFNGSVALPAMAFAVGSGTKTFNGAVDLDSFSSNAGAVAFSGETTDIGSLTSGGNVSITAGTSAIGTLTGSGTVTLSGTSATVNSLSAGGNVSISAETATIGTLTQTAGTVSLSEGASLTLTTGTSVFSAGDRSLSGNLTIGENSVVWVKSGDAINYNDGADRTLTVQGALKLGTDATAETPSGVRWSFGSNNKLVLDGGTVYGAGDGNGYALDFFESNTVSITDNSEIAANMTLRGNGTVKFDVASDVTLTISGNLVAPASGAGSPSAFEKSGLGTIILAGEKSNGGNVIVSSGKLLAQNTVLSGNISVNGGVLEIALGSEETLTQASGQTFATTGSGTISVSSGTLALTGAVNLSNAIENAGTITIANTTTFALDNLTPENNVYTLISGTGTVSGWDALAGSNFSLASQPAIRKLDTSYSVLVGSGTLTWAGTVDNVWNTNATANWTLPGANNSVNFFDGDSVIFATADANVSLANDVSVGTMTVSQNLTLAGAGTIALSAPGNLIFENASTLSLGEGVTLNLGSSNGALDLSKVEGTGTVVYEHTVNGGGSSGLVTSANFTGTIDYTGNLNWSDTYNAGQVTIGNDGFTLRLSSRDGALDGIWGKWSKTFNNRFVFATNYEIFSGNEGVTFAGDVDATGVALSADGYSKITFAGETTTIGSLNFDSSVSVEFGGTATVGTLTQNHGTLTVSGDLTTNAYTGVNLSAGDDSTVNVSSGASWTNTGDFYLRHTGNHATTFTIDGNVNVGGKLYISGDGKGTIEINDGGVLDVSTLEFGQSWDGVDNKGSWVCVNAGGTLVLDAISIGSNLNTSELKLNGGTFGTSSAALTIDASTTSGAGAGALPLTFGAGTTSTIHTSVYENNAFGATGADITIVNGISGDGALNVDGAGTLTLSGTNTFTGGTTISGGKLIATNASALGTNTVTANTNGTLELAFADETFANALAGTGAVSVNSTGALTLSGDNSNFAGALSVDAGTLNASGTALGAGTVSVASGATLALSGNVTLFSTIENAGTVNIADETVFELASFATTNPNVYTLISAAGENVSGWDELTTANFTQSGTEVSTLRKSASGYTVLAGNGELTWTGASSSVWDTDMTANWTFDGGASSVNFLEGDSVIFATENAQVTFAENASVTPENMTVNASVTFSGTSYTIHPDSLTILADKTLTLDGSGVLVGPSSIANSGTIQIGENAELHAYAAFGRVTGSGRIELATSSVAADASLTDAENWTGTVAFTNAFSANNFALSGYGNAKSEIELAGFTGYFAEGNGGAIAANLVLNGAITINNGWSNKNLTFSGKVIEKSSGVGSFSFNHSSATQTFTFGNEVDLTSVSLNRGTMNFSGAKTTLDSLTISGGTVNFTAGTNTITTGTISGGTLALSGGATTVETLTLTGGTVNISAETVSLQTAYLGGALNFVKNNALESQVYTVPTLMTDDSGRAGGSLSIDEGVVVNATTLSNAWGLSAVTVNGELNISGEMKFATGNSLNTITGTGTISAETFVVGNVGQYQLSGGIRVEIGSGGITEVNDWDYRLRLGDSTLAASADWVATDAVDGIQLNSAENGGAKFDTNGHSITIGTTLENLSDSEIGSLTKLGAGTLTLSRANSYSGGTTISAGKLVAQNASALGANAVENNAELELTFTEGTMSNDISGTGFVSVNTTGTVTLSGANSYTGGTTISAGKLVAQNAFALGTNAVENDAELELTFADGTLSNDISGTGSVSVNTTGTATLSGTNSYTGGTTISGGKLVAASASALGSGAISVDNAELEFNLTTEGSAMFTQAENQTISTTGTGTISVSAGTLALTGEVNLSNAIENAGAITLADTTVFALDNLTAVDNVYTLISGTGTVSGWNELVLGENITHATETVMRKTAGGYAVVLGNKTLTWVGAADASGAGSWDVGTTAHWTYDAGATSAVYLDGDSLVFATDGASVVLENGITVAPGAMTVEQNVALTGEGSVSVANANLTMSDGASLSLAEGVILNLGIQANGVLNKNIVGAGTIVWGNNSSGGHKATINLSDEFTGTLQFSGKIRMNTSSGFVEDLGGTTKLVLDGVELYSGSVETFNVAIKVTDRASFADESANLATTGNFAGITFGGSFDATDKIVKFNNGTNTFAGTTTIGTLNIVGGTTTLSGGATITTVENAGTLAITAATNSITTLNTTGTLNVSGGTNTIGALNISGGTATFSDTTETAITTLSHTGGTVDFTAGTNSITTLSSNGQIKQTDGTLSVAGGNAVTLHQEAGTLNLVGDVTLSGSGNMEGLYAHGTVNIGDGNGTAAQVNVSRVEFGDSNSGVASTVTVHEGANLFVSGETNTWVNANNYKTNSVVLGEWSTKTTLTVDGFFKAESAEVGLGDSGADIVVNGTLAAKGLGQAVKTGGTFNLTLNDDAWLILGESGIANVKTSGTATFNAGTVASFTAGTTIAKNLVLNSATGTTFNTYRYVATEGGFYFHDHNNDTGSAIVIDGVVSGNGKLITVGNGSLALANANTYTGGTEIASGKLIAANASALGTNAVTNNAELELTFAEGTMSNSISGAGSLSVNTTGTVTLSGTNTYTGDTTVAAGTLKITNANALGSATNSVTVNADATLELGSDMSEMERSYTLAGGTLKATSATNRDHKQIAQGDNAIKLTADSVIQADADFGMTSSGYNANQINLNGNTLTKTGAGTFTLVQTSFTAGTVRIEEGTINAYQKTSDASAADFVVVGGSGKIGVETSSITLSVGSLTLEVSDSYTGDANATLSGAGTLTIGGDGKITVKRSELAALDVAAETAYTYQIAASGASFDDSWTTSSFNLQGWSSEWFVQSYEGGLLTIAIPEPTSFGLLAGLGALLLVGTRRRKRG